MYDQPSKSVPFLKLSPIRANVKSAIDDVIKNGIFMNGIYTDRFIDSFSKFMDQKYVIPTANCTDALEIILRCFEVKAGDEIITTAFSWFSDASVIQLLGAKIVFCDIDLNHFGIRLSELEAAITSNTKAVILPHLFGSVHPEIENIASICRRNNIKLIEDCAQAHGASWNNKLAGTFGDITAFSFYPTKNLGALGDAGAIVTNQQYLAEKCKLWSNHGQSTRNEHVQLGRNSRMDELQAAVISVKLPTLDEENTRRQKLAAIYFKELAAVPLILPANRKGHVYHQFVIRTNRRDALQKYLLNNRIETDIHYPTALTEMSLFSGRGDFIAAREASETVLSLPIHPNHSEEDIKYVALHIKAFFTS